MMDENIKDDPAGIEAMLTMIVFVGYAVASMPSFKSLGVLGPVLWVPSVGFVTYSFMAFIVQKDKTLAAKNFWSEYKPDVFKTEHERVMETEPLYDDEDGSLDGAEHVTEMTTTQNVLDELERLEDETDDYYSY